MCILRAFFKSITGDSIGILKLEEKPVPLFYSMVTCNHFVTVIGYSVVTYQWNSSITLKFPLVLLSAKRKRVKTAVLAGP